MDDRCGRRVDGVSPPVANRSCSWCPRVGECPVGLDATRDRLARRRPIGEPGRAALEDGIVAAMEATLAARQGRHLRAV